MKSEERHYLAENELEKVLSGWQTSIGPHIKTIVIGLAAVLLCIAGFVWWSRSGGAAAEAGWSEFISAKSADEYATVADRHAGKPLETWSRLRAGELYLNEALQTTISDSKLAESRLKLAGDAFRSVLTAGPQSDVKERAMYGLAVATEAQCNGDPKGAIDAYKAFQVEFPNSRRVKLVEERIAALGSPSGKEFYTWFASTTRTPENRPAPKDWKRTGLEDDPAFMDLGNKPDEPARPFPNQDGDLFPGDKPEMTTPAGTPGTPETPSSPAAPEKPVSTSPAEPGDKPGTDTPTTDTPGSDKPATDKPATEAPQAGDKPTSDAPAKPESATPEKPATEAPATSDKPATEDAPATEAKPADDAKPETEADDKPTTDSPSAAESTESSPAN